MSGASMGRFGAPVRSLASLGRQGHRLCPQGSGGRIAVARGSVPCRGTGRGRVPPRHTPGAAALNGLSRSLAGFPNVVCLG